jgi:hypothetical protein
MSMLLASTKRRSSRAAVGAHHRDRPRGVAWRQSAQLDVHGARRVPASLSFRWRMSTRVRSPGAPTRSTVVTGNPHRQCLTRRCRLPASICIRRRGTAAPGGRLSCLSPGKKIGPVRPTQAENTGRSRQRPRMRPVAKSRSAGIHEKRAAPQGTHSPTGRPTSVGGCRRGGPIRLTWASASWWERPRRRAALDEGVPVRRLQKGVRPTFTAMVVVRRCSARSRTNRRHGWVTTTSSGSVSASFIRLGTGRGRGSAARTEQTGPPTVPTMRAVLKARSPRPAWTRRYAR